MVLWYFLIIIVEFKLMITVKLMCYPDFYFSSVTKKGMSMKGHVMMIIGLTWFGLVGCTAPTSNADQMSVSDSKYSQPSPQNVAAKMISPATH